MWYSVLTIIYVVSYAGALLDRIPEYELDKLEESCNTETGTRDGTGWACLQLFFQKHWMEFTLCCIAVVVLLVCIGVYFTKKGAPITD